MLKTRKGSEVWLITQPVHAELAGRWQLTGATVSLPAPGITLTRRIPSGCDAK
jgi:hypothetical protein